MLIISLKKELSVYHYQLNFINFAIIKNQLFLRTFNSNNT